MNKVGNFMDDSVIIVKVKVVLVDYDNIKSIDIFVEINQKVVILSGFVESLVQVEVVVKVVKGVEGVIFVSDKFYVCDNKEGFVKGYVGDMVMISEVKVKLLVDDFVFFCKVKVEMIDGVVQFFGIVEIQE